MTHILSNHYWKIIFQPGRQVILLLVKKKLSVNYMEMSQQKTKIAFPMCEKWHHPPEKMHEEKTRIKNIFFCFSVYIGWLFTPILFTRHPQIFLCYDIYQSSTTHFSSQNDLCYHAWIFKFSSRSFKNLFESNLSPTRHILPDVLQNLVLCSLLLLIYITNLTYCLPCDAFEYADDLKLKVLFKPMLVPPSVGIHWFMYLNMINMLLNQSEHNHQPFLFDVISSIHRISSLKNSIFVSLIIYQLHSPLYYCKECVLHPHWM